MIINELKEVYDFIKQLSKYGKPLKKWLVKKYIKAKVPNKIHYNTVESSIRKFIKCGSKTDRWVAEVAIHNYMKYTYNDGGLKDKKKFRHKIEDNVHYILKEYDNDGELSSSEVERNTQKIIDYINEELSKRK